MAERKKKNLESGALIPSAGRQFGAVTKAGGKPAR
jgi:hypothetical protein